MNGKRNTGIWTLLFIACLAGNLPAQDCVGWWKFDDSLRLQRAEAGFGSDLELVGSHNAVDGPAADNRAARVPVGSSYRLRHGIAPNGGGAMVNAYTLRFDFRVRDRAVWHCFFQTDTTNASDGDFFVNPTGNVGVGMTGYSSASVAGGEWYRLVVSVELGKYFRWYIDGQLVREGGAQTADERFALAPLLLLFADENGEDGEIDVAEIMLWDRALTSEEAAALGGFGHSMQPPKIVALQPYLQSPTPTSIFVSWHDSSSTAPAVEYGTTSALGSWIRGSGEDIDILHRWQTVQLTGLHPDREYFYRCVSGSGSSPLQRFRSAPDSTYRGHLRFLIFGDSQSDTARFAKTVRYAKATVERFYGEDLHNQLHLIAHVGDIMGDGSVVSAYLDEYFRPLAPLSGSVPAMISIGNHEGENPAFYSYMKYEDPSPFKSPDALAEKFFSFTLANTHFVFLNSHLGASHAAMQTAWLASDLAQAEGSKSTDFTFVFTHRPGRSEIWPDGNTSYVQNEVIPALRGASKTQQLAYGHTHSYERGVVESLAPSVVGDFRLLLCGGAAGGLDRWGMYPNQTDYPEIHTALDHHFFVLIDIDVAGQSYTGTMYSFGNPSRPLDCIAIDSWHRKLRQPAPDKPACLEAMSDAAGAVTFRLSDFTGADSVMSTQFQITGSPGDYTTPLVDTVQHWRNIHSVDILLQPIDRNAGIDMGRLRRTLPPGASLAWRGRYRDHNLRWSEWSDEQLFGVTGIEGAAAASDDFEIGPAYPNPSSTSVTIPLVLRSETAADVAVFDMLGRRLRTLLHGRVSRGTHPLVWDGRDDAGLPVSNGLYLCRMIAGDAARTLLLLR